jgi:hypothetical protein
VPFVSVSSTQIFVILTKILECPRAAGLG